MVYNVIALLKAANGKVYTKKVSSSDNLIEAKKSLKSTMMDNKKYPNHLYDVTLSAVKGISVFKDMTIEYAIEKVEK